METTSIRELGLSLHEAETAIGVGRRAVKALREQEPQDHDAIEEHRAVIAATRERRNEIRSKLASAKTSAIPKYQW